MIRVLYRWTVIAGQEEAFARAWHEVTVRLRGRVPGAQGSVLLRGSEDPSEFVAIARWDSREAWEASHRAMPHDPEMMALGKIMREASGGMRPPVFYEELDEMTLLSPPAG